MTNPRAVHTITRLVVATRNPGKLREIKALLAGMPLSVVPLDGVRLVQVPPEGGDSFRENALLKARAVAAGSGELTLADDSGLEVDALGGAPGVWSARFGGVRDDGQRNQLLLERLRGIPPAERTARFRCVIAVATPTGRSWTAEGLCEGRIALAPRGCHGFGYDPIFEIPRLGRTLAEVESEVKNRLSHRARALSRARRILFEVLGGRQR